MMVKFAKFHKTRFLYRKVIFSNKNSLLKARLLLIVKHDFVLLRIVSMASHLMIYFFCGPLVSLPLVVGPSNNYYFNRCGAFSLYQLHSFVTLKRYFQILKICLNLGLGVGLRGNYKCPIFCIPGIGKINEKKPGILYVTGQLLIGWWLGFLWTIGLKELRIRLAYRIRDIYLTTFSLILKKCFSWQ